MRKFVRECSLSLVFGVLFLAALVGQAIAGWKQLNAQQVAEGLGRLTLPQYLTSADFAVDVAENWQSEYLQFLLYLLGLGRAGSPRRTRSSGSTRRRSRRAGPVRAGGAPPSTPRPWRS